MTTRVIDRQAIERALAEVDVVAAMERGFAAYAEGRAVVPPVGELLFDDPPGDAHIKYGYIQGDDIFVIKVATGFYDNPKRDLPPNGGLMLIFSARDGLPEAVLLDEGHLTNVRTAAAGALAAKLLAPPEVERIGVLGGGLQAVMQVEHLKAVTDCREVALWARRAEPAQARAEELRAAGFEVAIMESPADVAAAANLIVTATAAKEPLLRAADIRPGTHITAMGSDTEDKRELAGDLLAKADVVVSDSLSQARERGEIHWALKDGAIGEEAVVELGHLILGTAQGRRTPEQITVADLTGVAVQDIEICKAVLSGLDGADGAG